NLPNGAGSSTAAATAPRKTTMEIVQQRFKADETVHIIFEAYQINKQEHVEGLLALVSSASGGTYAIVSFSFLRTPLTTSNELKINKVFSINKSFQIKKGKSTDAKGSISALQFDLSTDGDTPSKYFYHPMKTDPDAADFEDFYANVVSCKTSMWEGELIPETILNFKWLDDYREIGEVKQELKKRESQYIVYKDIIIYCATWNVNNKPCQQGGARALERWLARSQVVPDIYAIGLQEVDTTANALFKGAQTQEYVSMWIRTMLDSVHDGVQYEALQTARLDGIMLTVFVRKSLHPHILRCRANTVPRGVFFNTMGNKGGVGVSLQLGSEANFCFINSHLAAHMKLVDERNEDYKAIANNMHFDDGRTIKDHDHIFWLGDLNYRINEPYGRASLEMRLQNDQLRQEMSMDKCFSGYTEGEIRFEPTYKYDVGTDEYDSSDKQRAPAYCDRILWKGVRIEQLAYNSVMDIRHSDHKPVYAIFKVSAKTRDELKFKRVQEEVLKAVDKRENDNQPQITAETTVIDFGLVKFNEPAIYDFNVYNNCLQQVNFAFKVKDPPVNDICERWLHVDPRFDSLMIDSARRIRIKMLADANCISGLLHKIATTRSRCDFDILILDVESGRDIFITVTGEYQPSCFGLTMETMCRTDRPMAEYNQEELKNLMNDQSPTYRVTMPREFFLLIDYLHKQDRHMDGIFQARDPKEPLSCHFNAVRDWLDTWSESEFPGTPQTASEALMLLLELPEEALLEPFVENLLHCHSKNAAQVYIDMLSPPRRNVFMHLCMFLREGIERQFYELHHVAALFGRILLRNVKFSVRLDYQTRCTEFMRYFIDVEV
ncbi:Ocrl, partial [Drosophila busckii]